MHPRSQAFELCTPRAPWKSKWAAERAAPGTCVRFSEQVAKLKAQAPGLDWPYKVGVWVCAGAASRWRWCCAGPPTLPLPRRSPALSVLPVPLASREGRSRQLHALINTAGLFWEKKPLRFFLLWLSEAWNKSRTKVFIPVCGRVY